MDPHQPSGLFDVFKEDPTFLVLIVLAALAGSGAALLAFFLPRTAAIALSLVAIVLAVSCTGLGAAGRASRIARTQAVQRLSGTELSPMDLKRGSTAATDEGDTYLYAGLVFSAVPLLLGAVALILGLRKSRGAPG